MPTAADIRIEVLGRELLEQHFDAIAAIDRESMGERAEPWQREHFFFDLPGKWSCSMLAADHSGPIAFAIRSIKGDVLHGHRMAVRADYRRSGVGRRLYLASARLGLEQGCRFVTSKVAAHNAAAAAFHHRLGGRAYGFEGPNALFIHDCARLATL